MRYLVVENCVVVSGSETSKGAKSIADQKAGCDVVAAATLSRAVTVGDTLTRNEVRCNSEYTSGSKSFF
jgi:hypothetical protein